MAKQIESVMVNPPKFRLALMPIGVVCLLLVLLGCEDGKLDSDAKKLCREFAWEFANYGEYEKIFRNYPNQVKRASETVKGKKVVDALADLVREIEDPRSTSDSVWKIKRKLLAMCGFDPDKDPRSAY